MAAAPKPKFSMKDLIEAGVHFGHKTMRWNPLMAPYLYGERNNVHIIDLRKTVPMLNRALRTVEEVVRNNGRVLFVGTKRQASEIIAEEANRCGQYYVNHRWLGGMLTNWKTVSNSIKVLRDLETKLSPEQEEARQNLTKKEQLDLNRRCAKLARSLGGIADMGGQPDLIFVVDTNRENLAVLEAQKLGIPVIAVVDSNSNPEGIDYPIPGNDDAARSIKLYCSLIADAVLAGIEAELAQSGQTVTKAKAEKAPVVTKEAAAPAEAKEEKKPAAKKAPAKKEAAAKEEKKPAAKKAPAKKEAAATEEKKPAAKKAPAKKAAAAKEEKKPAAKKAPAKKAAAKAEKEPAAKVVAAKKKADAKDEKPAGDADADLKKTAS